MEYAPSRPRIRGQAESFTIHNSHVRATLSHPSQSGHNVYQPQDVSQRSLHGRRSIELGSCLDAASEADVHGRSVSSCYGTSVLVEDGQGGAWWTFRDELTKGRLVSVVHMTKLDHTLNYMTFTVQATENLVRLSLDPNNDRDREVAAPLVKQWVATAPGHYACQNDTAAVRLPHRFQNVYLLKSGHRSTLHCNSGYRTPTVKVFSSFSTSSLPIGPVRRTISRAYTPSSRISGACPLSPRSLLVCALVFFCSRACSTSRIKHLKKVIQRRRLSLSSFTLLFPLDSMVCLQQGRTASRLYPFPNRYRHRWHAGSDEWTTLVTISRPTLSSRMGN